MLLKLVGTIFILAGTSVIGFVFSRDCARRPIELKNLQVMLQMLENEILFMSNVLPRAFYNISEGSKCNIAAIFKTAADYLVRRVFQDAGTAWEEAIKNNVKNISLNKEDTKILISFGKMLGSTDTDGQIKNIRLIIGQLNLQEKKAEEAKKRNIEMYRNLGVLGGIALVIILF